MNTTKDRNAYIEYTGETNMNIDENITKAEVSAALAGLKTTSAAGEDGISNKMLKNLDDRSL